MAVAGTLEIQMLANLARLQKDMNQAKGMVGGAMKSVEGAVSSAKRALGSLGIGLGVGLFVRMVKGALDAQDELSKLSQKVGISVEELAGLKHAADLSGISFEGFQKAIKGISTQMFDAASGLKESKRNFAALGIEIHNADGTLKNAQQVMLEIADKFQVMRAGTEKTALSVKMFSKSGLDMIPVLDMGSAALAKMIAEGQRLNPVTTESAKQAEIFNDNLTRLGKSVSVVGIRIMNDLLPFLSALSEIFAEDALSGDINKAKTEVDGLTQSFSPLTEAMRALIILGGNFAFTFEHIGIWAAGMAAQFNALATGGLRALTETRKIVKEIEAEHRRAFDMWEQRILNIGKPLEAKDNWDLMGSQRVAPPIIRDDTGDKAAAAAAKAAAAAHRSLLEARLKAELDTFKSINDHKQAMLEASHQNNLISDASYFRTKMQLAKDASEAEIQMLNKQIAAQTEWLDKQKKGTAEYWKALQDVEQTEADRLKVTREFGQLTEATYQQAVVAAESYKRSIESVNIQIMNMIGQTEKAAAAQFELQNRDLRKKAVSEGDTAGVAAIDRLGELTRSQAAYNSERDKLSEIVARLQIEEERIQNTLRVGAIGELDGLQRTGAARVRSIEQQEQIIANLRRIAQESQNPALILQADQAAAALERLRSESDLLGQKFDTIFSSSAADAFSDFISGAKSASEAFKSFSDSVVQQINRMVSEALAKKLFNSLGMGGGGVGGLFGLLFGGGSGANVTFDLPALTPIDTFATGTDFVPRTGLYQLHKGESVTPASENKGGRGMTVTNIFQISGPTDARSQAQIAAAAGRGVSRAMARNG